MIDINKIFIKIVLTFIISILCLNNVHSQNAKLKTETIHLITDRSVYLAGEEIQFSAFYESFNNSKFQLSNILYIELYNDLGAFNKAKYKIIEHKVFGSLQIPEDLLSGNYYIRAYTKYQRNFPTEWMNVNLVSIINPHKAYPEDKITKRKDFESVAFESANNTIKLIFRLNQSSFYETKKIIITDSLNRTINESIPLKNGLSIIDWNTKNGIGLIKQVTTASDTNYISKVSDIEHSFVSIETEYENSELKNITLQLDKTIAELSNGLNLLIKSPDYENVSIEKIETDKTRRMNIDETFFKKAGFYYFIILDKDNNIIYIASHFINFSKNIDVNMSLNKKVFSRREKASIKINFKSGAKFDYGIIRVTKRGLSYDNEECLPLYTTYDFNVLNSFLSGKSVSSEEYSDQINATILLNKNQLNSDSFKKQLFFKQKKYPIYIPDIKDISIEGTITEKNSKTPIEGLDIFASVVSGNNQIHHFVSDEKGQFIFSLDGSKSELDLFITAKPIMNDIEVSIRNDFHEKYVTADNIPLIADTANIDLFTELFINNQTEKIFKKGIDNNYIFQQRESFDLKGMEDYSFLMKDYIESSNVSEIFNEIIPFVKVSKSDKKYVLNLYNEVLQHNYQDPLILVDYMPIFNIEEILKINPAKIEKIDLINQQYVIGDFQFNGIILIKTNTKDFADIKHPENSVYLKYIGSERQSIPTFPTYESEESLNDHKADFRNLLYYKSFSGILPDITEFYTSDLKGEYDIFFYGKTKEGTSINLYDHFSVK